MVGSVTLSSEDLAFEGKAVRNQTSQNAPLLPTILVPCCSSAWLMAGASSAGGAPAGSLLYWAHTVPAAKMVKRKHKCNLRIKAKTILDADAGKDTNGAGDGIRTRDIDLGKVALYQLSYSRSF